MMNINKVNPQRGTATATSWDFKNSAWQRVVVLTLAFWLGSSLILDLVIMPSLYATGMMVEPGFTTAGYSIFWIFNRVEILAAALVLSGILVDCNTSHSFSTRRRVGLLLAGGLLAIALTCAYTLTPSMSALGLQLNLFEPATVVPATMNQLHYTYWGLEALKLAATATLIGLWYPRQFE